MENPSEPISDATYFDCLEGIIERSKVSEHLLCSILHSYTTHDAYATLMQLWEILFYLAYDAELL